MTTLNGTDAESENGVEKGIENEAIAFDAIVCDYINIKLSSR